MGYFQGCGTSDGSAGSAKPAEAAAEDAPRTAPSLPASSIHDNNPFNFNVSMTKPTASSDGRAADATEAAPSAGGVTSMPPKTDPARGGAGSNSHIGFREALMRRQGSSPSSFFAVPPTPGGIAQPVRASVSSSGSNDGTSNVAPNRWPGESSGSSKSGSRMDGSAIAAASQSPKRSIASQSWLGKSPRGQPAPGVSSDPAASASMKSEASHASASFFASPHASSSSPSVAAASLQRNATNFGDAPRTYSPQDVSEGDSTTATHPRRPVPKSVSSSSSTTTVTSRPAGDGSLGSGWSSPAVNAAHGATAMASKTSSQLSASTSPQEPPPSLPAIQTQQTPSASSSTTSPPKQHSCPLPSLRLPFIGGSGASKLPSGACASLPSKVSAFGVRTGISRALGGGAAGSRKGSEIVQNPRFKTLTIGAELKQMLEELAPQPSLNQEQPLRTGRNRNLLVLDLRPHTAFVAQGRLRHAINICVPSTLLRRPNFALNKIAETISSRRDQAHFNRILDLAVASDKGKGTRVVILDQETLLLSQDSMVHSLMSKIEKAGYEGDICWIKGGWNAIQKCTEADPASANQTADLTDVVELDMLDEEAEEDEEEETIDQRDVEAGEEQESADDLASSETSDAQDTRTPRQPFPSAVTGQGTAESTDNGASGAYFQNYLQGPRAIIGKGRSSQSSFTSTASSDSLFPSSIASSQSSVASAMERGKSTSPVTPHFDSNKVQLPHLRPSTSPSQTVSPASSASSFPAAKFRTLLGSSSSGSSSSTSNKPRNASAGIGCSIVRPKNLPMAAFQYNSTAQGATVETPQKALAASSRPATSSGKGQFQMGLDNDNANIGKFPASLGMEKSKSATKAPFGRKTAANPFFDNIKQNIESQSIDHVLEHVAPLEIPREFTKVTTVKHLPKFLRSLINLSPKSRAEKLHKEYFDIEQAEQRRLQRVLDWHCQQSVVVDLTKLEKDRQHALDEKDKGKDGGKIDQPGDSSYHPFSISAGVEKGHLNRYKNMWPYEHARVRLDNGSSPTCGDYINASHIHLRGTPKRYIASQGPLEQTTEHFWRLVMQENVHVIVMLTLLQEGGREKCSNYFQTATYGDIEVELVEEKGSEEAMKKSVCKEFGFFSMDEKADSPASSEPASVGRGDKRSKEPFYASTPTQASDSVSTKRYSVQTPSGSSQMQGHKRSLSTRLDSAIVRRTIELRRKSDPPNTPPKVVRHIQYIKWPDFDIPPDPNVVIDLISETNRAQRDLAGLAGDESPVLVHCSAGVGRTGTFIAVDTLLERYRRERHQARTSGSLSNGPPCARVRRSGSDAGLSSTLQDLSLTDDDASPTTTSPGKSNSSAARPPAIRSSSSQETPRHLSARLGIKELLPEDHSDPILSLVNQMREQRMSSVANAGQYIFTYLALMAGISQELAEEGIITNSPVA